MEKRLINSSDDIENLLNDLRGEYSYTIPRYNQIASDYFPTSYPYIFVWKVTSIDCGWNFSWEIVELTDFLTR